MFLTIARTFKEATSNFVRNGWLSIATVSILVLSLYMVSTFFVVTLVVNDILKNTQDKADISIYFKTDVSEKDILSAKSNLEGFKEVKSVSYVSRAQALIDFNDYNADKPQILKAIEVIGGNPLPASLNVRANNPMQYQLITDYANKAYFSSSIDHINFDDNKETIDRLNNIIGIIRRLGIGFGAFFATISLLITFNAIRITIYTHRQEIEIMRLVGASNFFIRLPFIFEGIIYGVAASIVTMIILLVSVKFLTPYISSAVPSSNLVGFYLNNFWLLLGGQVILGSLLGVAGSVIAMRKYLKV